MFNNPRWWLFHWEPFFEMDLLVTLKTSLLLQSRYFVFWPDPPPPTTAAGDRFDRSRGRSIESIDSIDSIIFRSLAKFLKNRSRRDDRFRQKIVKIRAILAIFRPFEDFGDFRFDRFDIFFDSIDTEPNDRWGPPWYWDDAKGGMTDPPSREEDPLMTPLPISDSAGEEELDEKAIRNTRDAPSVIGF